MMFWNHGVGMGWMTLSILLWMVLIVGVLWIAAHFTWAHAGPNEDSAEAILKRRYANGEIDHDEYERRLNDIRK